MNKTHKLLVFVLTTFLLLALSTTTVQAQDQPPLDVTVDPHTVVLGNFLTLTIVINSDSLSAPDPEIPALEGFNVLSSSKSSSLNILNGNAKASTTYTYHLQPIQEGEAVIPPISVTIRGKIYTSKPITIQVLPGNAVQQPEAQPTSIPSELQGKDFFVEMEVDNDNPFIGQPVLHTFRFYQGRQLYSDQVSYTAPAFTGFWSEKSADWNQYNMEVFGRIYFVSESLTLLFPTTSGELSINPAQIFISGGFFDEDIRLETEPLTLHVRPLPDGAPAGFDGAVGQFSILAEIDKTTAIVAEPITLKVTLSGQGNLKTMPDPVLPEITDWRSYESQSAVNASFQGENLVGNRVVEWLLVPRKSGNYTLPPILYVYFDPQTETYIPISTEPITVPVEPAEEETVISSTQSTTLTPEKETVEKIASDIRYLKPVPSVLIPSATPLPQQGIYWAAWAFPLLAIGISHFWDLRQNHFRNNQQQVRSNRARKQAQQAIHKIRKANSPDHYQVGLILTNYLSDRLSINASGMTRRALLDLLKNKGLDEDTIQKVSDILDAAEASRFAPSQIGSQNTVLPENLDILINLLEKSFS